MKRAIPVLLVGALLAAPATAGQITQFEDVGMLQDHLLSGGPPRDGIPAMTNPEFDLAAEATWVADDDIVIGVARNGIVKAYPEALGWWHEIINDRIGDDFITVSLCPLTGTPQVFDATDSNGRQIEFGVSGLLINSNLVMYDRRDNLTLYPQMLYIGINGTYENERLRLLPAVETTFGMWKKMYPETLVARFGTGLERYSESKRGAYTDQQRFEIYPYSNYRTDNGYFIAPLTTGMPDLSFYTAKELVTGICAGDNGVRAYPFADMAPSAVVNDTLGGQGLLVVFDIDSRTSIPYSRNVDGQTLTFYQVEAQGSLPVEFMDVETRSRWDLLGRAVSGPLEGSRLEQLPAYNSMWFAWSVYWPQTTVWQAGDGIIDAPPPITAVLEPVGEGLPEGFGLDPAFPNPFNPTTRLHFSLPVAGQTTLRIYNSAGQLVRDLADGKHRAGVYEVTWDGTDDAGRSVASGTYISRLEMPPAGLSASRRLTLVR